MKRYLGFDFGTKRIGIAVGQSITKTASPLVTISAKNGVPNWQEINKLINEWNPAALIVGLPLKMDGSEQLITQLARNFSKQLQQNYNLPIYEVDERLTTAEAKERVFSEGGYRALKKEAIDSIAAKLVLESWLMQQNDE